MFHTKIIALLSLIAIATACGKTDPVSEYNLKAVPQHGRTNEKQVDPRSPFIFEVVGGTSPDFVQGQTSTARLRVRVIDPNVTGYELVQITKPNGSDLKRVDFENWDLTWTPQNVLGDRLHATTEVQVQVKITEAKSPLYKVMTEYPQAIRINVVREGRPPTSTNAAIERTYVKPGEAISFSLDINDPSTAGTTAPTPNIIEQTKNAAKAHCADGRPFVKQQSGSPARLPDGKWRFTFVYDLTDGDVSSIVRSTDTTTEEIPTCFSVIFNSAASKDLTTPVYPYTINVRFPPAKAEVSSGKAEVLASARSTSTVRFTVGTGSKRGTLALDTAGNNLETLPGNPKLTCTPNSKTKATSFSCQLVWKLDCASTAPSQLDLRLKATHDVAGEKLVTDLVKTVTITKTERQCPTPKAAKPAAPAKAPATTPVSQGAQK